MQWESEAGDPGLQKCNPYHGQRAQMSKGLAGVAVSIGVLLVAAIPTLVIPALQRQHEANLRIACAGNLYELGHAFQAFVDREKERMSPHLSGTPGQLMCEKNEIYPQYLTDINVLICPSLPDREKWRGEKEGAIDDESYFYLGYAVTNDKEVAGFCEAYREHMTKRERLDGDLTVPKGMGNEGSDKILQLREGVERFGIPRLQNIGAAQLPGACLVPLLIERPDNHAPKGGNVLYIDGHVEFINYGNWPMTDRTINALLELDAMGK